MGTTLVLLLTAALAPPGGSEARLKLSVPAELRTADEHHQRSRRAAPAVVLLIEGLDTTGLAGASIEVRTSNARVIGEAAIVGDPRQTGGPGRVVNLRIPLDNAAGVFAGKRELTLVIRVERDGAPVAVRLRRGSLRLSE